MGFGRRPYSSTSLINQGGGIMSWTQSNMSKYSSSNHTFPRTYGQRLSRKDFEDSVSLSTEFLLTVLCAAVLIAVVVMS